MYPGRSSGKVWHMTHLETNGKPVIGLEVYRPVRSVPWWRATQQAWVELEYDGEAQHLARHPDGTASVITRNEYKRLGAAFPKRITGR